MCPFLYFCRLKRSINPFSAYETNIKHLKKKKKEQKGFRDKTDKKCQFSAGHLCPANFEEPISDFISPSDTLLLINPLLAQDPKILTAIRSIRIVFSKYGLD